MLYTLSIFDTTHFINNPIITIAGPPSFRPWASVIAGHDGNVYVDAGRGESADWNFFAKSAVENSNILYDNNYLIFKYDTSHKEWSSIAIKKYKVNLLGILSTVDGASNLYFFYNDTVITQITKVSTNDGPISVLTKQQIGSKFSLIDVSSDGKLNITFPTNENNNNVQIQNTIVQPISVPSPKTNLP